MRSSHLYYYGQMSRESMLIDTSGGRGKRFFICPQHWNEGGETFSGSKRYIYDSDAI